MNVFIFLHTYIISPTHTKHYYSGHIHRYSFDFIFKSTTQTREPDERIHFRVGFYTVPTHKKTKQIIIFVAVLLLSFFCTDLYRTQPTRLLVKHFVLHTC